MSPLKMMFDTSHFVLQKKGGSGKSLIASTLFQYLTLNGHNAVGIDIDPSNKTFAKYVELKVTKLEILGPDKKVDPRLFDVMLQANALPATAGLRITAASAVTVRSGTV